MQKEIFSFKLCKCHQTGGKCFIESGFAICQFRKTNSYFGKFIQKPLVCNYFKYRFTENNLQSVQ